MSSFFACFLIILMSINALAEDMAKSTPTPSPSSTPSPKSDNNVTDTTKSPSVRDNSALLDPPFIEAFPQLSQYIYKEPPSGVFFGFGGSPAGVLRNRFQFTANVLQVHYMTEHWMFEAINASIGITQAQTGELSSRNFVFRTSPKYRFNSLVSLGPLLGLEFISFPGVGTKIYKTPYISPDEPFSSQGVIYGIELSETWPTKDQYMWQVSEVAYQETYSYKQTAQGWNYVFDDSNIGNNPTLVGPSMVLMIEISFLF